MLCSVPPWLRILARRPMNLRCVSTRARNLAARHWELVRLHSPHPAERHVLDHEATKAAIVDHTGLKATTDVIIPSAPKEIYFRGIKIPQRPNPPESDECCMSGCAVCVYDLYLSSLDDYKKDARAVRTRLREKAVPVNEWPDDLQEQDKKRPANSTTEEGLDDLDMDPSMKAFLILEKKLGKK
ncbi:oxidoreductase-like protein, amino-terminal protein [Rhizoctonia solani 123E]|uniref:Oxidoreductase-like protein, amino-terminal protein n=1 Tax=Rhizoctonia solani 123E TaxID=1423351 RepID=A0A074S0S5_9AGAM|nr:oxidoreductase-like protein, amino-terminal protein [Rhizoctonia solani 123E]